MRYNFRVIRIIETIEAFEELRFDWDALARMPQQTFAWCRAGWDYLRSQEANARLAIFVFYDEPNTTRLILPTYVDGSGTLRFILDTFADHCDALYKPGENQTLVLNALQKAIRDCALARFVRLRRLPADSVLLHHFGASDDIILFREGASLALRLSQAESLETALPHLRKDERKRLRKDLRLLEDATCRRFSKDDPFPREEIARLKAEMVSQGVRTPEFVSEDFADFIEKLYQAGLCEVMYVSSPKLGDAMKVLLVTKETVLTWIILYTNRCLPSLMDVLLAQDLIARGGGILDFGAGVYSYKSEALRPQAEIAFTLCFGKGLRGWLRAGAALLWRQTKDGIKAWKKRS